MKILENYNKNENVVEIKVFTAFFCAKKKLVAIKYINNTEKIVVYCCH